MTKYRKSCQRSLLLLLIFLSGVIPPAASAAAADPSPSADEAFALVYFSDAVLSGYTDLEAASLTAFLSAPPSNPSQDDPDNAALAAALQAAKEQRNDLDASCSLLVSKYRAAGKDCEADRIQAACDEKRQGLNSEIGRLHDLRGDRRRAATKIWHWLKRSGQGFWHRIGPLGRNFLRQTGPEILQVVASGGTLNSGVLKNILKQQAKAMGRQRLREIVYQGVERLLLGQLEIAQSAGIDICDPGKKTTGGQEDQSASGMISTTLTTSEVDFAWQSLLQPEDSFHVCGGLWPNEDEAFQPISIPLLIDYKRQTLTAQFSASRKIENLAEGDSGPVVTRIDQQITVKLEGPYQASETVEGVVLS